MPAAFKQRIAVFVACLNLSVLLLLTQQNCAKSFQTSTVQADNSQAANQNTGEGGNGEGYDGKIFVHPGKCEKTAALVSSLADDPNFSPAQQALIKASESIIITNSNFEEAKLLREACVDLEVPRPLDDSAFQFTNLEWKELIYQAKTYWQLDELIPPNALKIVLDRDAASFHLASYLQSIHHDANTPIEIEILRTVTVYSGDLKEPTFAIGGIPGSPSVTVINRGKIYGTRFPSKTDQSRNLGYSGSAAFETGDGNLTLLNFGEIVGGAGAAGAHDCDSCFGCGAGDGASQGGDGGDGIVARGKLWLANFGLISGGGGAGSGGGGGYDAKACGGHGGHGAGAFERELMAAEPGQAGLSNGGAGGDFGLPGLAGGNAGNGAAVGGAGGRSIEMNRHPVIYNGIKLQPNPQYSGWLPGTKGRVAP